MAMFRESRRQPDKPNSETDLTQTQDASGNLDDQYAVDAVAAHMLMSSFAAPEDLLQRPDWRWLGCVSPRAHSCREFMV